MANPETSKGALKIYRATVIEGIWEDVRDYILEHKEMVKGRKVILDVSPCSNKKCKRCN